MRRRPSTSSGRAESEHQASGGTHQFRTFSPVGDRVRCRTRCGDGAITASSPRRDLLLQLVSVSSSGARRRQPTARREVVVVGRFGGQQPHLRRPLRLDIWQPLTGLDQLLGDRGSRRRWSPPWPRCARRTAPPTPDRRANPGDQKAEPSDDRSRDHDVTACPGGGSHRRTAVTRSCNDTIDRSQYSSAS
jgi:hypothetical protein